LSKIIKGGEIKFFSFLLEKGGEEEEFNPLKALLPEEALYELERLRKENAGEEEIEEIPEEKNLGEELSEENPDSLFAENELPDEKENSLPEGDEEGGEASLDLSSISLEELLQHPEVSERLAHLEQEAYEKGFAQGQKDGEELGRKQYETLANRMKEILRGLEKSISEHVLALEPQLFALLKVMLKKLVLKEVSTSPEVIKNCLKEALKHVVEQTRVRIHLHPEDAEFLEEILGELREELSKLKDFEIVSDANLHRGGCLLETDFGLIDATLDRRWKELTKLLEDESS